MYVFLIPLMAGFIFHSASAFTAVYSQRWGEARGRFLTIALRDLLGIPAWLLGFVLAARMEAPRFLPPSGAQNLLAWILVAVGSSIILGAIASLRWRAMAPSMADTLVERGPFAYVRHPIHVGTFLQFVAIILLRPTLPVATACILGTTWLAVQTRLEEKDLVVRLPDYANYARRVPRFFPRLRM